MPASIHSHYRGIKTFARWLKAEGLIDQDPTVNIKTPRVPRQVINVFSDEDIKKLLVVCYGDCYVDRRNSAMVLLLLDTGLRLSEMASLRIDDLHLNQV